jgi:hypothetical protein
MSEVNATEEAKKAAELSLEALIEAAYPGIKLALTEKIKDLVPGEQFDGLVDLIVPPAMEIVKVELLKQVEKISEQV